MVSFPIIALFSLVPIIIIFKLSQLFQLFQLSQLFMIIHYFVDFISFASANVQSQLIQQYLSYLNQLFFRD